MKKGKWNVLSVCLLLTVLLAVSSQASVTDNNGGWESASTSAVISNGGATGLPLVLVYEDDSHNNYFLQAALDALGYPYVLYFNDMAAFTTALNAGGWDIVAVDHANNADDGSFMTAIDNYVKAGGRLVISSWQISNGHSLWATCGLQWKADNHSGTDVYRWTTSHPIFNTPDHVNDFTWWNPSIFYGKWGSRFAAIPGVATLVAGYTINTAASMASSAENSNQGTGQLPAAAALDPDQGAILVRNDNKVIVNGFLVSTGDETNGTNLWKDELVFLSTCRRALIYDRSLDHKAQAAANNLGISYSAVTSDLAAHLTSATWDLVIIDAPAYTFSAADMTAIENYVKAGGKLLMSYYDLDATSIDFQHTLGVEVVTSITSPLTLFRWSSYPLFSTPNRVPDQLQAAEGSWIDDGDKFNGYSGGIMVAGYVASSTSGEGAVVIGNSGRTICNGLLYDNYDNDADSDGKLDIVELIENQIYYLCNESSRTGTAGNIRMNHAWQTVNLSQKYLAPVIISGPPTYHGTDPGVARLRNVTGNSFEIRFQEWDYEDGQHTLEHAPYLVMPAGRHFMPGGGIWEAGTLSISGTGVWTSHTFTRTFCGGPPALFLTLQTYNGPDAVTVRARNITSSGFDAALFEEEDKMDGHTIEKMGYLAIEAPSLSGVITLDNLDNPYLLQVLPVDQRFAPVLSSDIKVEEEQSQDSETAHISENVAVLALGNKIFAQDISTNGSDPAAIRRLAPEYGAAMEWGTVDGVNDRWIKIPLAKDYLNPVVVARPVSFLGGDPGVIRIRKVSHNSFELRYNEWAYEDGAHTMERVFYMVAEAGIRSVAGLTVEAGTLNTYRLMADGWEHVTFAASFSQFPDVFTSVQTFNGADPVTTRIMHCTASGFDLTMQEEEAKHDGHVSETIGWIAIKRGTGSTGDSRFVSVLKSSTTSNPTAINFGHTMARRFPVVISDMISTHGADPGFLRYQDLGPASIKLFVQEETSADPETGHTAEDVSLFVAE